MGINEGIIDGSVLSPDGEGLAVGGSLGLIAGSDVGSELGDDDGD